MAKESVEIIDQAQDLRDQIMTAVNTISSIFILRQILKQASIFRYFRNEDIKKDEDTTGIVNNATTKKG